MNLEKLQFRRLGDARGYLTALESGRNVPFDIKRAYYIYGTESGARRGYHAHRRTRQLAICLKGSCRFLMDDGCGKQLVTLDSCIQGLLVEPMIWHEMDEFSPDCIILVLASDYYDEADYIRDRSEFLQLCEASRN